MKKFFISFSIVLALSFSGLNCSKKDSKECGQKKLETYFFGEIDQTLLSLTYNQLHILSLVCALSKEQEKFTLGLWSQEPRAIELLKKQHENDKKVLEFREKYYPETLNTGCYYPEYSRYVLLKHITFYRKEVCKTYSSK